MKKIILTAAFAAFFVSGFCGTVRADDNFDSYRPGLTSPIERCVTPTPGDSTELAFIPRAIFVKNAGTVSVKDMDSTTITFTDGQIATGIFQPLRITRVMAATTATVMICE